MKTQKRHRWDDIKNGSYKELVVSVGMNASDSGWGQQWVLVVMDLLVQ